MGFFGRRGKGIVTNKNIQDRFIYMVKERFQSGINAYFKTLGTDKLDTYKSMRYNATASGGTAGSGNGMSNNRIYSHGQTTSGPGHENQTALAVAQNNFINNTALQFKHGRYIDTSNNINNLGAILTTTNMNNEFRPYYTRSTDVSGSYNIWYDYAVVKLGHVFESLNKIGLVKRFDATVRLWINTGTINATIAAPRSTNMDYSITASNNTFSNTLSNTLSNTNVNENSNNLEYMNANSNTISSYSFNNN